MPPARALLLAAAWAGGWALLARADGPPPASATRPGRPVRVLVPARNEATALPRLLASLAAQTRPADSILVIDDASGDGTGDLARAAGVEVLDSPGPPPGWSGKCAALDRGQAVTGDGLLVFLDADVTLAPDGLARLAAAHAAQGGRGIVTAEPWHAAERPHERLSLVANTVALMGSGAFGPGRRGRRRARMAFGPCLVIDRGTYDAVGGHAHPDVRSKITEDLALARRVRALGLPVTVFAGRDVVAFRMYPDGLRQAFDGWTKVLATGFGASPPPAAAATAGWVAGALVAAGAGGRALGAVTAGRRPRRADVALYTAWATQLAVLGRRAGHFPAVVAAAFPVPLGFFVAAFARSAVLIGLGRELAWRGRRLTGR